jgi:hypothetical protein
VAVQDRGNDTTVEKTETIVMLRMGAELSEEIVVFVVAAEMESTRVGVTAPEAGQVWVKRLLDAQFCCHHHNAPSMVAGFTAP